MMKNNKQYFFILGINPELSIAEIISLFKQGEIDFEVNLAINSVLIVTCAELPGDFFSQLGGSKKYGVIEGQTLSLDAAELTNVLDGYMKEDKFRFGFSFYNFSKNELRKSRLTMRKLGLAYKKELKAKGVKSRLVESRDAELSSVIVHKEKMVDHGADVVLIKYHENIFYGKTLAVQDYNAFSARDYGKPGRDVTSGMLPPKLARIMLNLATPPEDAVILDPFCGSGTVILEALALGFKKIYGSDKSAAAIEDTARNLIWWQQRNALSDLPQIKQISVEQMGDHYDEKSIDIIVTEPFLGPPLRGRETSEQIRGIKAQLQDLYGVALGQFVRVLKSQGKIVMVWPVFVDKKNNQVFLNLKDKVDELDLEVVNCLTDIGVSVGVSNKDRQAYYYCREGQKVCREIVVLQKR